MADFASYVSQDTIVAPATPPGSGAIAIVRLSGPQSLQILGEMWVDSRVSVGEFAKNRLYYGKLAEKTPKNVEKSVVLDEVMAVFFKSPQSFTGEDVVEIHCHGNTRLVQKIINNCIELGARQAEPGEFSRRAFLSGRIDLAQAEAISQVIQSASDEGLRRSQAQLGGQLSRTVAELIAELTQLRAFVEASIDFPEEDIELLQSAAVLEKVQSLQAVVDGLLTSYRSSRVYQDGARVVLFGAPNAGKSSLFNALLGEDRALVHQVAGTTRDSIEADIYWDGLPITLIDTAGVRDAAGEDAHASIEAMGVLRARDLASAADCCLVVVDASAALSDEALEVLDGVDPRRTIVWLNKSDLPAQVAPADIETIVPGAHCISGSATSQLGLAGLRDLLQSTLCGEEFVGCESATLVSERHRRLVTEVGGELSVTAEAIRSGAGAEFVAEHLLRASQLMGEVVGEVTTDDLLDEIFSKFCIGK